ncbi:hypothetical protein QE152_g16979 [Popillia japonica]|uniref:Uncharacterized protein n=1 Tax=Popillia japonica TaxID=7064 RepID=A0AAW1L636_POPJA
MCWRKSNEVVSELHVIDPTGAATVVIGGDFLINFDDFMNYMDDEVFEMDEYINHFGESEAMDECEESEEIEENEETETNEDSPTDIFERETVVVDNDFTFQEL